MVIATKADITYTVLAPSSTVVNTAVTVPAITSMSVVTCTASPHLEVWDGSAWQNYETMGASQPTWIANFDAAAKTFDIASADSSLAGQSNQLRYAYTEDESPNSVGYETFNVIFDYECLTDEITLDNSCRGNQENIFGDTTSVCSVLASHTKPNCPLTFGFEIAPDGSSPYGAFTGILTNYVGMVSPADGAFTIDTAALTPSDKTTLQPTTTTWFKQTITSTDSTHPNGVKTDLFTITLSSKCNGNTMTVDATSDISYLVLASSSTVVDTSVTSCDFDAKNHNI